MDVKVVEAYLHGAFHDGTLNRTHQTFRFCQKEKEWLELLQRLFQQLGIRSWIYKEGKERNLFVLETTAPFLKVKAVPSSFTTSAEKIAYIRGYFDAEGGVPKELNHWFYIQLCQKNQQELTELKDILEQLNIKCGKIHIPSIKTDPNYFRLFISRHSHREFIEKINSWHPRKQKILELRMKI